MVADDEGHLSIIDFDKEKFRGHKLQMKAKHEWLESLLDGRSAWKRVILIQVTVRQADAQAVKLFRPELVPVVTTSSRTAMALPSELISHILFELWSTQSSTNEYIQTFSACSLVSKQWSAIIKEINSTHLVTSLFYSGGYLYTIPSMSSMPHPLLCRTITFKVDCMLKPDDVQYAKCNPSITANRGTESVLRRLFNGPVTPPDGIHIYVYYLDDPQVHIPRFWLPLQTTRLTIVYHYRWWVFITLPRPLHWTEFQSRVMFGERELHQFLLHGPDPGPGLYPDYVKRYIPMFEQSIPLGSVGYIHPFSKKFIVLFNAIDPASSAEPRINRIPSLLKDGHIKVTTNPKYSPSLAWDYEYKKSDILHKLGAWTKGRSLGLGRAICRELVGDQFGDWLSEHRQTITDVFGDHHPYICNHLELVTTTVDSSQYVWFIVLVRTFGSSGDLLYFQVDPQASRNPGHPWGRIKPLDHREPELLSWDHVSTVGQLPMTVQIRCHFIS
ncbi:uncharacterized protein EV420DRAFT_1482337 [Desarmillaria tabescens]|uniref:F-box domain-containing protein n=1 Tax=Armillaria tabescens TaxID=1929756 RepID=A0AA39K215_ARMTA|nr:uncharacterized protein EV420DRAFT_1482337 [Desarmillaria tabescens]KAK0451995.1 hypothetical protein EV420DRAFT_1482337 [Desarmillaria tabescens]